MARKNKNIPLNHACFIRISRLSLDYNITIKTCNLTKCKGEDT